MRKIIKIFFYFLLFTFYLHAQQPTMEWVRRYNSQGNMGDLPRKMAIDKFGNIIVTGFIGTTSQATDMATLKYNSSGVLQWVNTYNQNTTTNDVPNCIATDSTGNIFVAGTSGYNLGPFDIVTIKYSNNGVQQWAKIYNGTAGSTDDYAGDIGVDKTGNIYVCGGTGTPVGPGNANGNAFLIKYNTNGDTVWVRRYPVESPSLYAAYRSLAIDKFNNIYVTGIYAYYVFPTFSLHSLTAKYDSNGVLAWSAPYISIASNLDYSVKLALDSSRNAYVTGYSVGQSIPSRYLTIKYSSSGVQQWVRNYPGPNGYSEARDIKTDKSGNAFVTGSSYRGGSTDDIATIEYNPNGDSLWVKRYTGPGNNGGTPQAMSIDDSANIYIIGNTTNGITALKYTTTGFQQWVVSYPGQSADIAIDNLRNVYVTGMNTDSGNGFDFVTIKYAQPLGIRPISYQIPNDYLLYQNYPNPFNNQSNIKFQISKFSNVKLIVYDILGRKIVVLVDQQLAAGTYNVDWNADNYSSGVYYYRLNAEGFTDTKSMILVK